MAISLFSNHINKHNENMQECLVERLLKKSVDDAGGLCIKLNPLGYVGIPDRLVLLPGGIVIFVEVKRPKGGKITPMQHWWAKKLKSLGIRRAFVFTRTDVVELMEELTDDV